MRGTAIGEALRLIAGQDVRGACDVLRPVFDATGHRDGRVSIGVDPRISGDAARTAAEAHGLWWLIDRPCKKAIATLPAMSVWVADRTFDAAEEQSPHRFVRASRVKREAV